MGRLFEILEDERNSVSISRFAPLFVLLFILVATSIISIRRNDLISIPDSYIVLFTVSGGMYAAAKGINLAGKKPEQEDVTQP